MATTVTLVGDLIREPEIRYTSEDIAITTLVIKTGDVDYHTVIAHQDLAENVALSLYKGNRVVVYGTLYQRVVPQNDLPVVHTQIEAIDIGASLSRATAHITGISRAWSQA